MPVVRDALGFAVMDEDEPVNEKDVNDSIKLKNFTIIPVLDPSQSVPSQHRKQNFHFEHSQMENCVG